MVTGKVIYRKRRVRPALEYTTFLDLLSQSQIISFPFGILRDLRATLQTLERCVLLPAAI